MELRQKYPNTPLKIWLKISKIPRSSFYEWKDKLNRTNLAEVHLQELIKSIIDDSRRTYGYRRVVLALKKLGMRVNHKRVLRIMRENNLLCNKFIRRSRRYSSFKGEIGKIANNELNRDFKVKRPNEVWVSDVTEFRIHNSEKKLYLSPIMDLYNSEILSFSLSTSPTVSFTNLSLEEALKNLPETRNLMIHTDQGCHYQHKSWVEKLEKNKIKQSMSRRGNCLDNSPMENFFGILKQEMYYGVKYTSIEKLKKEIEEYIYWYNRKRIKKKLSGLSPVEYRLKTA